MSDLLRAGDGRAGRLFTDTAVLSALVRVEQAWLDVLVETRIAPPEAATRLEPTDVEQLAAAAAESGNPVAPFVQLLRDRLGEHPAATWVHRGLTSQDVMDTALVLCLRETGGQVRSDVTRQVHALAELADRHRASLQAARTLTQHAVPTTFGAVVAGWLHGVLDAATDLRQAAAQLPVQCAGAAGTLAGAQLLGARAEVDGPALAAGLARRLDLVDIGPWHTRRRPLTRFADALVACTDAWGKIAEDVALRARPEIAELAEPIVPGRGGSSTMPHKQNPVLAVLIRAEALTAPPFAAQLHGCAAAGGDERPAGAWQAEWPAVRGLARSAAAAAALTAELLEGLRVDIARMREIALGARAELLAEQHALAAVADAPAVDDPAAYLGATDTLVDRALARARDWLADEEGP